MEIEIYIQNEINREVRFEQHARRNGHFIQDERIFDRLMKEK